MLGKWPVVGLAALVCVQLLGCASALEQISRDPRDTPWDPKPGQGQLIDQIPNWDGNASRVCCGHLRTCQAHQSPRC